MHLKKLKYREWALLKLYAKLMHLTKNIWNLRSGLEKRTSWSSVGLLSLGFPQLIYFHVFQETGQKRVFSKVFTARGGNSTSIWVRKHRVKHLSDAPYKLTLEFWTRAPIFDIHQNSELHLSLILIILVNCQNQIGHNLAKYAKQNCYNYGQCFPLSFLTQLLIQAKKRGMGFPSIVAVAELRKIDDTSLSKWHLSFHLAVWVPSNIYLGFLYCGLKAAKL